MAKIVCSKCGATGISKCPSCRTVFPDNQVEAMLSHCLKTLVKGNKIEIQYSLSKKPELSDDENISDVLKHLVEVLKYLETKDPGFKQYGCSHRWVFAKGQKSDIDCGCPVGNIED